MKFNNYIWDLYKNSENGKNAIAKWASINKFHENEYNKESDINVIEELKKIEFDKYINGSQVNWFQIFRDHFQERSFNIAESKNSYKNWVQEGIKFKNINIVEEDNHKEWTSSINFYSKVFYSLYPDYFFPYIFHCEFNKFQIICREFEIPIPEVPNKTDWKSRALYYIDLCEALFEFRKINNFSASELCAFLYDFAINIISSNEDKELPEPSKVWFVGGSKNDFDFLDSATEKSSGSWQGNIDSKKGDIIIMYCVTPRSYIHSIWRVGRDGFADPFFYYYSTIFISNPIILNKKITQKDLVKNKIWAVNPLIRKNLQGVNGYPIKYLEYLELLAMLKEKGQNISILPLIKQSNKFEIDLLKDERDVEIKLIEPLLHFLNYSTEDWIRQMPVKMGRGERNYPDYCFKANSKRGEESAIMILESKFSIRTNKELQDAYFQAKSYALRLQSDKFVIASKEGVWIYQPKNGIYKFENSFSCNWNDIENPDIFHKLKQIIENN